MNVKLRHINLLLIFSLFGNYSIGQQLSRMQLAKTVVWALKYSNLDTLLKLTVNELEFKNLAEKEQRVYDTSRISFEVKEEQKNIRYRYEKLKRRYDKENPNWDSTQIERIIFATEKVKGNSFSSVLVETLYNGKKYYIEIDTVLTINGWKIQDDIMTVDRDIEKRIKYKNRKMVQY